MNAKTKPAIPSTESALFAAVGDAMSHDRQGEHKWREIIAPGMLKVYKTYEYAKSMQDRFITNAVRPNLAIKWREALDTVLEDTRSNTGKTVYELNVKQWKASKTPEWLLKEIDQLRVGELLVKTVKESYDKKAAQTAIKTYDGFRGLVKAMQASARSACITNFVRACKYAWPEEFVKPATTKPATDKPEGEPKPEDSKLNPRQTLVQLLNNAKAYAQKHEDLPSQVAAIAAISKAIELLGS